LFFLIGFRELAEACAELMSVRLVAPEIDGRGRRSSIENRFFLPPALQSLARPSHRGRQIERDTIPTEPFSAQACPAAIDRV